MGNDEEYSELIIRLRDNHSRRNQAQLFAFTASFALFVVLLPLEGGSRSLSGALYLMPYIVLIPLSCRIAYSRICHARIDAYLSVAYPGRRIESDLERTVPDLDNRFVDKVIELGVNFEPLLIGLMASFLSAWNAHVYADGVCAVVIYLLAMMFPLITLMVLRRGLDYSGIRESFVRKWKSAL